MCTTSHDDTSAFSLCDGKLVVLCITDLSVGQANILNAEQLSFCRSASKSRNETEAAPTIITNLRISVRTSDHCTEPVQLPRAHLYLPVLLIR